MKKLFYALVVMIVIVSNLMADSEFIAKYDPEQPVKSPNTLLSYQNLHNKEWLIESVKKINSYIETHPYDRRAYYVRAFLVNFLYTLPGIPKAEKLNFANIGLTYALNAVKQFGNEQEFYFWYINFLAEKYLLIGLNLLKYAPELVKRLKELVDSNPHCCRGFPLFILGRFYYKLPSFPISVGDYKLSEKYLKLAVKINPNFLVNYLFLAETLNAEGKKAEAIEYLNKAQAIKPVTWVEYVYYKDFYPGIKILKEGIKNNTWTTRKDIFLEIDLRRAH